ncbi:AAA family ATPase [Ferrimonas sp.]|uniref:AAA family ATPase n=1 Tax=Ferrimonas sp. TaxID=2080861 RepID=UPI003A8FB726
MKDLCAYTKNVDMANSTLLTLLNRSSALPGFGLLDGPPGVGKTTATIRLLNSIPNGIYIRAVRLETTSTFLDQLLKELGERDIPRAKRARLDKAVDALSQNPRVLFIDEADYYMGQPDILETIRDIQDLTDCTIMLIGMNKIAKKIATIPQLDSRIRQRYEFQPADLEDLQIIVETLFEEGIKVGDTLLRKVIRDTGGNLRNAAAMLEEIEKQAIVSGLDFIDMEHWQR